MSTSSDTGKESSERKKSSRQFIISRQFSHHFIGVCAVWLGQDYKFYVWSVRCGDVFSPRGSIALTMDCQL